MLSYLSSSVVSNDLVGDQVRHLILRLEQSLDYHPGQFVMLRMKDDKGNLVERSYSLANNAGNDLLEFVIRIDPEGQMTPLIDRLQAGDEIDVKGPFGHFGKEVNPDAKKLLFIAGGVGISPIRGLLQQCQQEGMNMPIQLFYGFRTGQDFLFREEIENMAQEGLLEFFCCTSRDDDSWTGLKGYIHEQLEEYSFSPEPGVECFICGPPAMVKASKNQLIELGFERSQIHVEAW